MAAIAPITLNDSASEAVVFTPQSKDANGVVLWMSNEANLDAKKQLTMSVKLPANGSTVSRVKQRIMIPVMDPVDGVKQTGQGYADIVYVFPKTMSEGSRLDLRSFVAGLTGHAVTTAAATSLESNY